MTEHTDRAKSARRLTRALQSWYRCHRRDFPWRAAAVSPGVKIGDGSDASIKDGLKQSGQNDGDPYAVWVSEVMLQQTSTRVAADYYRRFMGRWPDVGALADAPLDDVLHLWQGLGYYARARAMHAAAVRVRDGGGVFPCSIDGLRDLPGIGEYIAGAVRAMAFDKPAAAIDTNVFRLLSRLDGREHPSRTQLRERALSLIDRDIGAGPADTAQALIELGAQICTARNPDCGRCCWMRFCRAYQSGRVEDIPARRPRAAKKRRYTVFFWCEWGDLVLIRRRGAKGLLAMMGEFPSLAWRDSPWRRGEALALAPLLDDGNAPLRQRSGGLDHIGASSSSSGSAIRWRLHRGRYRHVFSHIDLGFRLASLRIPAAARPIYRAGPTGSASMTAGMDMDGQEKGEERVFWVDKSALCDQPFSSLGRKVMMAMTE